MEVSLSQNIKVEIGLLKDKEGNFTRTPQETLALLMNTHFPECKDATPLNEEPDQPWSWMILDENHPVVKPEEVAKSFGPMKSPGPDTIYPIALRELPHDMVELIARLYSRCIENRYSRLWLILRVKDHSHCVSRVED